MAVNANLKYEQVNWGWLNDYAGYKFAPITFLDQILMENGDSFKSSYDTVIDNINDIKDGDIAVKKAQTLVSVNDDGVATAYTTATTKPVYFKNGIPKECSSISGLTTIAGTTIRGDTFTFNNPLSIKVGLTEKSLNKITNDSSIEWNSNEIGFFGFRDAGIEITQSTDLNSIVVPGAYYSPTASVTGTIVNKPTGIIQAGFRLLVLPIYNNISAARIYSKQYLFDAGTAIYIRQIKSITDNVVEWTDWRKTSFVDDIPDVELTGDVTGTIDSTGKIETKVVGLDLKHSKARANLDSNSTKDLTFADNATLKMGLVRSEFQKSKNRNYMKMITYAPTSDDLTAGYYVFINKDGGAEAGVYNGTNVTSSTDSYITSSNSNIVFMGAAWNDYAEFRDQIESLEAGYCVASTNDGKVYKTTEKFQACDGIVSDTYGFAIGRTEQYQTPLAVSGRVLAYFNGNREDYNAGDTVCAGPNGKICKMTREEIKEYPDRIIGIVSEIPEYEEWNSKKVNNRIWIKVK